MAPRGAPSRAPRPHGHFQKFRRLSLAHARRLRKERACEICTTSGRRLFAPTSRCKHGKSICKVCFSKTVQMQVRDMGNLEAMPCPITDCCQLISHSDIQKKASRQVFQEYDELLVRRVIQRMSNFIWCKAEGCGSGQLHEGGAQAPVGTCNACGARFCFLCDAPMHDGETCKSFQRRMREERLSEGVLEQATKACPRCGRRIEKIGGCDHMTCRQQVGGCGHEFCWRCLADYGPIRSRGNHYHHKSCQYYFRYESSSSEEEEEGEDGMDLEEEEEEEEEDSGDEEEAT